MNIFIILSAHTLLNYFLFLRLLPIVIGHVARKLKHIFNISHSCGAVLVILATCRFLNLILTACKAKGLLIKCLYRACFIVFIHNNLNISKYL